MPHHTEGKLYLDLFLFNGVYNPHVILLSNTGYWYHLRWFVISLFCAGRHMHTSRRSHHLNWKSAKQYCYQAQTSITRQTPLSHYDLVSEWFWIVSGPSIRTDIEKLFGHFTFSFRDFLFSSLLLIEQIPASSTTILCNVFITLISHWNWSPYERLIFCGRFCIGFLNSCDVWLH